ncbi:MbtH family protein [Azospirillum sp. SYSU D00513]|uniref:MbtH family protein n=1 Tax=Azospirillum sp. SYSU D00513 TaxID=2812561 RepID=UPI001A95B126|nr:MbtH family protein [Azospirillum sp. SYSU D00513]
MFDQYVREDTQIYDAVVNQEKQYSIWPASRGLPLGWSKAGFSGDKTSCLHYIEQFWLESCPA